MSVPKQYIPDRKLPGNYQKNTEQKNNFVKENGNVNGSTWFSIQRKDGKRELEDYDKETR